MKTAGGGKKLTSKEAARLLGVSEASVKRWADSGLLPTEKTAGGHRRFRPEDVAVFRRTGLQEATRRAIPAVPVTATHPDIEQLPRGDEGDEGWAAEMFDMLLGGHSDEASALLVRLHLHGRGIASLADAILCPAMRKIGDLWHQGELSVAQEHLATRTALDALQALRVASGAPEVHGRHALCCSTEEDFHELPVRVAALLLEVGGWEVTDLGTSTPFYALAEAVERFRPRLVCVASTILMGLDRAAREYEECRRAARRAGAPIVLGGAGFAEPDVRRRFPAELHADCFRQLEEFAASPAARKRSGEREGEGQEKEGAVE